MARYWQPATKNFKYMLSATPPTELNQLRSLIASSLQQLAGAVNAELTRLYWSVGQRLRTEVLGEGRASYGFRLLDQLGQQLTEEFDRGFESRNLRRMVKFAEGFPDAAIVSTLSTQLSWSHMVAIVALKTPQARQFYANQTAQDGWSVRELYQQIERKAFERTELAALQAPASVQAELAEAAHTNPALVFKDPYFLQPSRRTAQPHCQRIGGSVLREVGVYNAQRNTQSQRS